MKKLLLLLAFTAAFPSLRAVEAGAEDNKEKPVAVVAAADEKAAQEKQAAIDARQRFDAVVWSFIYLSVVCNMHAMSQRATPAAAAVNQAADAVKTAATN